MKIKKNSISLLEYSIAFLIIINSNTIWGRQMNENMVLITTFLLLSLLNLINVFKIRNKINKSHFFYFLITFVLINIYNLIFILINKTGNIQYFVRFILIFSNFIIYSSIQHYNKNTKGFMRKISNLVALLAIISLLIYFLGSIFKFINPTSTVYLNWGGEKYIPSYYNVYFETQTIKLLGVTIIRNSGIFTEAPMYSFILCLVLVFEMFINKSRKKLRVFLLIFTIISTFSTTGIILVATLIFIVVMMKRTKTSIMLILKFSIMPILIILLSIFTMFFIEQKVNDSIGKVGSYSVRLDDYRIGYEVWKDYKLSGVGFLNHDFVKTYMSTFSRGNDIGGSNSIMIIASQGGTYLLMLYFILIYSFLKNSIKNRNIDCIVFNITMIFLITLTNIPYTNIILYYLSLCVTSIINREFKKHKVYI